MSLAARDGLPRSAARNGTLSVGCILKSPDGHNGGARVAFLSDLHTGSHSDDVLRLNAIVHDVAALAPDLVLYGGDYVNMQPFGGGRVPPRTIAAILSRLEARLGRFAILGNHDYVYGARAVIDALEHHGIPVLDHARRSMRFQNHAIDLVGVPDAGMTRGEAYALLA